MNEVVSAIRWNAVITITGAILALVANVAVARAFGVVSYGEYATFLALVSFLQIVLEAGGNAGFVNVFSEARTKNARLRLFYYLLFVRGISGGIALGLLIIFGPALVRVLDLPPLTWTTSLFVLTGILVSGSLVGGLGYYGLLAGFRHSAAQATQQVLGITRSIAIAALATAGAGLVPIVVLTAATIVAEAAVYIVLCHRLVAGESDDPGPHLIWRSLRHGFFSFYDKASTYLGTVPFLLLALSGHVPGAALSVLAVAGDVTQKSLGLFSLPLGGMILPYLNRAAATEDFALPVQRVASASQVIALLIGGFALAVFGDAVPLLFGDVFVDAGVLALALFLPAIAEGWARQSFGAALLAIHRYRFIVWLNTAQGVAAIATLIATTPLGLIPVVLGQGVVRLAAVAALIAAAARAGWLPRFNVKLTATVLLAAAGSWVIAHALADGVALAPVGAGLFLFITAAMSRVLPLIDRTTQEVLWIVLGPRISRRLSRLLGVSFVVVNRTTNRE